MKKKGKRQRCTDAEVERLGIAVEEMGEALQIIGKIQRHGFDSKNPLKANSKTNRVLLERELGDVLNAIDLLIQGGDVREERILRRARLKREKIKDWLHYTQE